jgi:hypothetical protein
LAATYQVFITILQSFVMCLFMSLSRVSLQYSQVTISIIYCKGDRTELEYPNPSNQ